MKGRYIGDNINTIYDIMFKLDEDQSPAIIVAIECGKHPMVFLCALQERFSICSILTLRSCCGIAVMLLLPLGF